MTLDTEDEQHALGSFSKKGEVYDAEHLLSYVLEYATYLSLKDSNDSYDEIVNIIEHFIELEGQAPDVVIGGFHLMEPRSGKPVPAEQIEAIAERLLSYRGETGKTRYYTCHCTGTEAFEMLKMKMGRRIAYLSSGMELDL